MARAKMDLIEPAGRYPILPILIHGDAAFAGQGVVAETLNLSLIKGYRVGGTIHLIINNQLGFTTPPESARSSEYPTDVAKMVQAPILHVNGDDPEACVRVARLAFAYRQQFNKDVVIDMVCYRRHGHNEGDDPSYTQPLMYKRIEARRSVRKLYTEALVKRGDISLDEAEEALDDFQQRLQNALDETRQHAPAGRHPGEAGAARARRAAPRRHRHRPRPRSTRIFGVLEAVPDGFVVHPKLAKQFETRRTMFEGGEVDWALAEAMAFGSLLYEGTSVRLAGQDTRRGTFSHRHGVLVDYETGAEYTPLAPLATDGAQFWLYDSLLSEYAALGFEYGYSVDQQGRAGHLGGAVRRLLQRRADHHRPVPRGRRGQVGPDLGARAPAPARLRGPGSRALVGAHRAVPHAGRRGQHPGLQRHDRGAVLPPAPAPDAPHRAQAADRVHAEVAAAGQGVALAHRGAGRRLVPGGARRSRRRPIRPRSSGWCSARARSPTTRSRRATRSAHRSPIARVEQLFPWPFEAVAAVLDRYANAEQIFWLQEEPENMGPWNAIKGRLFEAHGTTHWIHRVSRAESGSPGHRLARHPPARAGGRGRPRLRQPPRLTRSWHRLGRRAGPARTCTGGLLQSAEGEADDLFEVGDGLVGVDRP